MMRIISIFFTNIISNSIINSEVVYISVRGKVQSGTPSVSQPTFSYTECLDLCLNNELCVLAYGNTTCNLYNYGNVTSVQQTDATNSEDIVTFRVDRNSSTCPSQPAINPPTFDNYPATGKFELGQYSYFYRISYSNGIWSYATFQQVTNITCPAITLPMERAFGRFCVSWVLTGSEDYATSYKNCQRTGSNFKFSAVESWNEYELVKLGVDRYGIVYLNGKMTPACLNPFPNSACDQIWSDSYMTLPIDIPWLPGYPTSSGQCIGFTKLNNNTYGLINTSCYFSVNPGVVHCVLKA